MSSAPTDCPTPAALEALASGAEVPDQVAAHVARCPGCASYLRDALFGKRFGLVLNDDALPDTAPFPDVFGYRVIDELARGGQGVVYRAEQETTGRTVAIKVLDAHASGGSRRARERFAREIQLAGSLSHPGIVRIFDSLKLGDGRDALVMELVEGAPLHEWIRATPRSPRGLLELLADIADAVHHAHQRGVIHRDLKPSNILIDNEGRPHLLDFGVARRADASEDADRVTRTGEFTGTLAYAAPEQVSSESSPPDIRTDVYALGVIGFEMLTGRPPYPVEGSLESTIRSILTESPPARTRAGIASDPWTVLTKALAKEAPRRYQSAADLARDLRHAARGQAIDARGDSGWYLFRKAAKRHRVLLATSLAVLVGLAGVLTALALGNARLSDALRESRLRQIRAHIAAGGRERAERVMWEEFSRTIPRGHNAAQKIWSGSLAERELLWCFVEMQSRATCLRADRSIASGSMGLNPLGDDGYIFVTRDQCLARLDLEDDTFSTEIGASLPPDCESAWATPSGRFAVAQEPGRLTVIDTVSGAPIASHILSERYASPSSVVVAEWGTVISSYDGAAQVLSVPDLKPMREFDGLLSAQNPWLDPETPSIVFLSSDYTLRIADPRTGESKLLLDDLALDDGSPVPFPQVLISPDRSTAVIAHGGGILVRDLETRAPSPALMSHPGYRVWVSHDPGWNYLAAGASGDPSLHLWSTRDWRKLPSLTGHYGTVVSRAFSPDSSRIITTDTAGTMRLWAAPGRGWRTQFGSSTDRAHQIAVDAETLFASDADGYVHTYPSPATNAETGRIGPAGMVRAAIDPEGRVLALAGMSNKVLLFDLEDPASARRTSVGLHDARIAGMRFRPDTQGRAVLGVCTGEGTIALVEASSGRITAETGISQARLSDLCWSHDGSMLYVSLRDGRIAMFSPSLDEDPRLVEASDRQIRAIAPMPDGRSIVAVGDAGRLIHIAEGRVTRSARFSEHSLFAVACHPGGRTVAVGDRAGVVTLLDAETMRELASFDAEGAVMAVEFSEDGRSLFVAALERPIERWGLAGLAETLDAVRPPAR